MLNIIAFAQINHQFDSLNAELDTTKNKSEKIDILLKMAELHYKNRNLDNFVKLSKQTLSLLGNEQSKRTIHANNILGRCYFYVGNYKEALIFFEQMLELATKQNLSIETAKAYHGLSKIYWRKGDLPRAFELNFKAKEIFVEQKNFNYIFEVENALCNFYIDDGEHEKAGEIYDRLALRDDLNDYQKVALFRGKGIVFFYLQNFDKAREFYQKSLDISMEKNDTDDIGIGYANIAETFEMQGDYENALQYYYSAMENLEAVNYVPGLIFAYYATGRTYMKIRNFKKAHDFLNKSLEITKKSGESIEKIKTYKLISETYAAEGKYEDAYLYSLKYIDNYKTIYSFERNRLNIEIEKKYHTNEKIKETEILKAKEQLTDQKLRNSKLFGYFLGTVLFLIIIVAIVVAFFALKNSKAHKELSVIHQQLQDKTEKVEITSKQLEAKNTDLLEKNQEIEDAHRNISQSIEYASYIQSALLPSVQILNDFFPENFILYKPKDVVSGDFYFLKKC